MRATIKLTLRGVRLLEQLTLSPKTILLLRCAVALYFASSSYAYNGMAAVLSGMQHVRGCTVAKCRVIHDGEVYTESTSLSWAMMAGDAAE